MNLDQAYNFVAKCAEECKMNKAGHEQLEEALLLIAEVVTAKLNLEEAAKQDVNPDKQ
jgi:hypothetical protein